MGQILAIDYGKRKIGLALSDEDKIFAAPLPMMLVKSDDEAVEGIITIMQSAGFVESILLGLPLGFDFKPTQMSRIVKKFAEKLKKKIDTEIKIAFTNEVLTSKQAEQGRSKKFKKEKSDSEAARIFLQEYLDHKNLK
ncbi:MAG TPA: Holliday junction resolvase RuvX [Candidatus Dojkabacteria bacterium]|jgi:putative Holliday junction resolvase